MMDRPNYITLTEYFKGEASQEMIEAVTSWQSENPNEFQDLQAIWEEYGSLAKSFKPDLTKAWNQIDERTSNSDTRTSNTHWLVKVAATVVIAIGMGWLYQAYTSSSNESPRSFLATNENLSINLTDGTSVILSPGSSLEVAEDFAEHRRSVYLKGKGFFDVEKDPLAFEVHLNEVRVLVHGTSFQVAEDQGQTEVIVKEGVVTVQAPQKEVTLVANEQVSFTSATSEWRKTGPVSENQFAWKTRVLTFSKTAMTDFARDLGKYYEVAIEVDEELVNRQITTRFNDQSLAEVFEVVQVTLGVKVDTIGARHFRIE